MRRRRVLHTPRPFLHRQLYVRFGWRLFYSPSTELRDFGRELGDAVREGLARSRR